MINHSVICLFINQTLSLTYDLFLKSPAFIFYLKTYMTYCIMTVHGAKPIFEHPMLYLYLSLLFFFCGDYADSAIFQSESA